MSKRKGFVSAIFRWIEARPARIIVFGFLVVILLGTLLLSLPVSSRDNRGVGFLRALFTATSATCVTGLVVVDTALHWTRFGQVVILSLIQVGGLGIVTVTTFFFTMARRKMGLKAMVAAQESTGNFGFSDVARLVRRIVLITFVIELIGALVFATRFVPHFGWAEGLFRSVFHAVSSFCNAGFDLMGDHTGPYSSLIAFNGEPVVLLNTAFLFMIGGLGFVVWSDLLEYRKTRSIQFHTRVVLVMTGILVAFGFAFFLASEFDNSLEGAMGALPGWQRPLAAFFQSVTPRTAGFNSLDQASLRDSSKVLTILYMMIGAAPGSTAGGIKITTFGVILFTILSEIRGYDDTLVLGRRLPRDIFLRSVTIAGLALFLVVSATLVMTFSEATQLASGNLDSVDLLFESASAFGTVGLSSAGTPQLTRTSWGVLTVLMYLGRVGPASFALSLAWRARNVRERVYPEGKTLVG